MPYAYHRKPNSQCVSSTGAYIECQVEWKFGHGLSYTSFSYADLKLSAESMDEDGEISASVVVTNTGDLAAKHSVLLFLFDMYRRVTPEYKLLKRFSKISLEPGASVTVSWTLSGDDLLYVGIDSRYILEGGEYRLGLGPDTDCRVDSKDCATFTFTPSAKYNAVCDTACQLWTRPICGLPPIESTECVSTCMAQQWTWNYVECLESSVNQCSDGESLAFQCFNAFTDAASSGLMTSNSMSASRVSYGDLAVSSVLSAIGGAVVAAGVAFVIMRRQKNYFMEKMHESHVMLLENEKFGSGSRI
jgi:hypothetical protein